jgi:hypothetical protein
MAQVFVGCGQHHPEERSAAEAIRNQLRQLGFEVYVAVAAQSIEDVNSGIIRQLKRSDYYVFVDFAREDVGGAARGSLFTNQELAIAYLLGFERVLFFQQAGLKLEGLLRYMGSNATRFAIPSELPALVAEAFTTREWLPTYSRHLAAIRPRFDGPFPYGELVGWFLYVDIENRRQDVPAFETVARLISIETAEGVGPSHIRSPLKVTGAPAFEQTIWPMDHGAFDLLALDLSDPTHVRLNSALDVTPIPTLVHGAGTVGLHYAVLARDFPVHKFIVDLTLTGNIDTTMAHIRGAESAG